MHRLKGILLLILVVNRLYSQNIKDAINKTAVEIKDRTAANQKLYTALKDYKFICIGEMHGTKEPAEFLTGLTRTFLNNKHAVIVGFEIPENYMIQFRTHQDSTGLLKSKFFSEETVDGRASEAWYKAINECNKLGATFCFFDNANHNRDSVMYKELAACFNSDTGAVVLTLTGNIHNKIVPYNGSKTMACYLIEHFGNKVCTINHINNGGTMFSLTSEGLGIHTIEATNSVFSTATNYDNYFIPNIFNITGYSGFFHTTSITASLPFRK